MSRRQPIPLVPREVLFGNPDKAAVRLSPSGTQISYLAPVEGVLNIWVGPVDSVCAAVLVTKDTHRGIRLWACWAGYMDGHRALGQTDPWHVPPPRSKV